MLVVRACKDGDVLTIAAERERDGAWQIGDSTAERERETEQGGREVGGNGLR